MSITCANCGGERGIHHYLTNQCPVGGVEAPLDSPQAYKTTTFAEIPFNPPHRLAKDLTVREYFAAMAMQGTLAAENSSWGYHDTKKTATEAVEYADALIEALNA